MAVNRARRARGPELLFEKSRLSQPLILTFQSFRQISTVKRRSLLRPSDSEEPLSGSLPFVAISFRAIQNLERFDDDFKIGPLHID